MSLLAWIALGLIAGFIASRIVGETGQGAARDTVPWRRRRSHRRLAVQCLCDGRCRGFTLYRLLVAVVGASALLLV